MTKEKKKKSIFKKWWFWLIAIIVIGSIASGGEEEEKVAEPASAEVQETENKNKEEKPNEKEPNKDEIKEEPKEPEKEEPKVTIANAELKNEVLTPLVKKLNKDIDRVEVTEGNVKVFYKEDITYWDETDIVKSTALDSVKIMEQVFKNPNVKTVEAIASNVMVDDKGNETVEPIVNVIWDRALNDEINYENFSDMVLIEFPKFYNVSSEYYIHPGVYRNVKEKYRKLFNTGASGVNY